MSLLDSPVNRLDGTSGTLRDLTGGNPALLVNVASQCGLTPQYTQLEQLQQDFGPRGFTVVGLPCNQFGGQEPGSAEEIAQFCSSSYGVSFPMTEKIEVNGEDRHPIYTELVRTADQDGKAGDIAWNFEKFVLDGDGNVIARFSPPTSPTDPAVLASINSVLPD